MYLVKILRSTSMDLSTCHEECEASLKNINILRA